MRAVRGLSRILPRSARRTRGAERWVSGGGSLLLIATTCRSPARRRPSPRIRHSGDRRLRHRPHCATDEIVFRRSDGACRSPITTEKPKRAGRLGAELYRAGLPSDPAGPSAHDPGAGAVVLLSATAWRFSDSTPRIPAEGMLQGAVLVHGRGRVAMFGEAAMFSAQVSGPSRRPMGMNAPHAGENPRFLLNLMHWLAERRPPVTPNQ